MYGHESRGRLRSGNSLYMIGIGRFIADRGVTHRETEAHLTLSLRKGMRRKWDRALSCFAALGLLLISQLSQAQTVNSIIEAEQARIRQAQQQQEQINDIVERTRSDFDNYQRELRQIYTLEVYNQVQQSLVDDQNRQLDELRASIDQVSVVERQITPLMIRMITGLAEFIELDVPFLLEERRARVQFLNSLIDRSDVSVAEKFRNVMEAWEIELDYGTFPETYGGTVTIDGVNRQVEFLKIGRVALLFLTPDRQIAGRWNPNTRSWDYPLEADLRDAVEQGVDMVSSGNAASAALFLVPVAPPEE